jgi:CheY-like chemotaxis protein
MTNSGHANLDKFENINIKVLDKPFTRGTLNNIITKQTGKNLNGVNKKVDQHKTDKLIDLKGARILLVEDNEINQEIMIELLKNAGLQVDVANNGKEGLKKVSTTVYDSVLMDIQMPEMDGYEATVEIRKLFDNKDLPIIAMTADAVSGVKDKCLKAGMDDFLIKPINVEEVFLVLTKWVKNRQVNQIEV